MCDGPLHRPDYATDVLACATCGPVVYLGQGRAPDTTVRHEFQGETPLADADRRAFPYLAGLLGKLLDEEAA